MNRHLKPSERPRWAVNVLSWVSSFEPSTTREIRSEARSASIWTDSSSLSRSLKPWSRAFSSPVSQTTVLVGIVSPRLSDHSCRVQCVFIFDSSPPARMSICETDQESLILLIDDFISGLLFWRWSSTRVGWIDWKLQFPRHLSFLSYELNYLSFALFLRSFMLHELAVPTSVAESWISWLELSSHPVMFQ